MNVVIFGASGYAGAELVRLVNGHSALRLVGVSGSSTVGTGLVELYPHLSGTSCAELILKDTNALVDQVVNGGVDVVFLALPNNQAVSIVPKIINDARLVVDLSADFRLKDASLYEHYYNFAHSEPELLEIAVYGLCELNRSELMSAKLIASPGCYVTAATLALFPFSDQDLISRKSIIVNGISGVSGAGRGLNLGNLFGEIDSNVNAYGLNGHRHAPEIEQNLGATVLFVPHVAPMTRGLLATCYADLELPALERFGISRFDTNGYNAVTGSLALSGVLEDFYVNEPFVTVLPHGESPRTKSTLGTNRAIVSVNYDVRTSKLVSLCAIDNMVKGAAGQAIQAMNIALGLKEDQGLSKVSVYP